MGCNIHTQAERRVNGKWEVVPGLRPLDWQYYGMYGFLANVRNYSAVTPLAEQRGLPEGAVVDDKDDLGDHSHSWLSVEELTSFNYDSMMEDRRFTRQEGPNIFNGAATAEPGQGEAMTWREFLGEEFFDDLEKLKASGAERVVFGFDG